MTQPFCFEQALKDLQSGKDLTGKDDYKIIRPLQSLEHIDAIPQGNFDEIIEKYVEMNIAHRFREGNGRVTRIWLDLILKKEIKQVVDWNLVDKDVYLSTMRRSVVKDIEIKVHLKQALTDQINDRALFMKGIDVSYYYEGFSKFKTEEL